MNLWTLSQTVASGGESASLPSWATTFSGITLAITWPQRGTGKVIRGHSEFVVAGQVHGRVIQATHVSTEEEVHKDSQPVAEHSHRNESLYGS